LNCVNSTTAGSIAYKQCLGALSNAGEFDINLIVVPGIIHQYHSYVTNMVVDLCEQRGDCFYIIDLYGDDGNPSAGQIPEVVSYAAQFDTNYAGTYYPWVKILDTNINQIVSVPASVVMPAVYAANDRVSAPWFAPAGLNRGGIPNAVGVTDRTTHTERDELYEGKVNPIAVFPGEGVAVWGQKTLQDANTALNRIGVRRLLIELKKFFASTSKYLNFEQNTAATRNKFLSIANPYMESVQQRSGLYNFFVKMDEETNTADVIDENILYGKIYVQPTKTVEFIVLDFNISSTGASFEGI
jgi:phage tail sheath protein FI